MQQETIQDCLCILTVNEISNSITLKKFTFKLPVFDTMQVNKVPINQQTILVPVQITLKNFNIYICTSKLISIAL